MLTDPLQNINQVGGRIDTLQLAGNQQALDHAYPSSAQLGPSEHLVPPTHRNLVNAALQMIRIRERLHMPTFYLGDGIHVLCSSGDTCRVDITCRALRTERQGYFRLRLDHTADISVLLSVGNDTGLEDRKFTMRSYRQ